MTEIYYHHPYYIGADTRLTEPQIRQLTACFEKPGDSATGVLGGRAAVLSVDLSGIGRVIVKNYTRGGWLRHINRRTYLKLSKYRCEAEFFLLKHLVGIGVNAPEPVAFAYRFKYPVKYFGGLLYHAWIVTREIENAVTLARLSVQAPDRVRATMGDLVRQVDILVDNHILHVDLHPGNVLVDPHNRVFLIDFDKARTAPQNRGRLREKYIRRWQRAVVKHRLPEDILIPDGFR
ncbi:MAG: lipopolysaccharide kinase InaA family protein [Desulfosalsimonadaceae bacterium]|nr:lipopolysaccharide kinase InaA family protein [Desulfosalsimonadaceae bacterium]